ncbi:MAG: COX15/CtaA family protein [Actinomycetota bacterium]|nr:COX15/CtaA family protein [Actinomycetota bacterium]
MGVSAAATRRPGQAALRGVAVASLLANIAIVLTGGAVRLTGSGLGCPAWPRCTEESYAAHGELGIHGAIEFGNRLLTFALAAVAVATVVVVWRARPIDRVRRRLALLLAVGVPAQAVLGGLTVLTGLDPWLVAWHLLVSLAMVAISVVLLDRVGRGMESSARQPVIPMPGSLRMLALATYGAVWVVVYLGTVVTGSGPHAGDAASPRNGLHPETVSQLHADAVFLLVGMTIGVVLGLRAVGAPASAVRAAQWLLGVELAQGAVGFVQYATDLPILLVELHLLGACLTVAAATWLLLSVRAPRPARHHPDGSSDRWAAGATKRSEDPSGSGGRR